MREQGRKWKRDRESGWRQRERKRIRRRKKVQEKENSMHSMSEWMSQWMNEWTSHWMMTVSFELPGDAERKKKSWR